MAGNLDGASTCRTSYVDPSYVDPHKPHACSLHWHGDEGEREADAVGAGGRGGRQLVNVLPSSLNETAPSSWFSTHTARTACAAHRRVARTPLPLTSSVLSVLSCRGLLASITCSTIAGSSSDLSLRKGVKRARWEARRTGRHFQIEIRG